MTPRRRTQHRAVDGERDHRRVHQQPELGGAFVAPLDRGELGVLPRAEQVPLAQDTGGDDLGQLGLVVERVVDALLAPVAGLGRLVAGRIGGQALGLACSRRRVWQPKSQKPRNLPL